MHSSTQRHAHTCYGPFIYGIKGDGICIRTCILLRFRVATHHARQFSSEVKIIINIVNLKASIFWYICDIKKIDKLYSLAFKKKNNLCIVIFFYIVVTEFYKCYIPPYSLSWETVKYKVIFKFRTFDSHPIRVECSKYKQEYYIRSFLSIRSACSLTNQLFIAHIDRACMVWSACLTTYYANNNATYMNIYCIWSETL